MEGLPKPLGNEVMVGRYQLREASDDLGSALLGIYPRQRQGYRSGIQSQQLGIRAETQDELSEESVRTQGTL